MRRMHSLCWIKEYHGEPSSTLQSTHTFKPVCRAHFCLLSLKTSYEPQPLHPAQTGKSLSSFRFYIMRLPRKGLSFQQITYHDKVTQCLGSIDGEPWYMAVAAPSGSLEAWPREEDLRAFRCAQRTGQRRALED